MSRTASRNATLTEITLTQEMLNFCSALGRGAAEDKDKLSDTMGRTRTEVSMDRTNGARA